MQGTWGRRVFGVVVKGPKFTRFRLEVKLDNGATISSNIVVPNNELEQFDKLYGYTLNEMVKSLDQRIKERSQMWASQ